MNRMYTKAKTVLALLAVTAAPELTAQPYTWGSAGPILTAGRARNMIVDRNNSSTLYVGSSTSGVFKSTDGGSNWAPVNDQDPVRNISYLAQSVDNTIYAGTGEGFLRYGQKTKAQAGTGLYKLSGTSLVQVVDTAVGNVINRVACHPTNASIIALATNKGIMVTTDGTSFTRVPLMSGTVNPQVKDLSYGMEVKFDVNGILYCVVGNERGSAPPGPNYAAINSKIFKSTDGTYTAFAEITPTSNVIGTPNYGRIELGIAPSDPNVVYASCSNKNTSTQLVGEPASASLKALFVSTDAGSSWKLITQGAAQLDPLTNGGSIATGDYAHVVYVFPTNPHFVMIGGYKLFFYSASASSPDKGVLTQVGNHLAFNTPYYLHENIHDIQFIPGSPNKFYFITDAGIYRSTSLVSENQTEPPSFQPFFKGLVTGQFNSVSIQRFPIVKSNDESAGTAFDPYFGYIGGTGGNGMTYFSGTNDVVSQEENFVGGEVYNAEFSKILPDAAFFSNGAGVIYRIPNVKSAGASALQVNVYSKELSSISATPINFSNLNITTGTPFRLWENYGQVPSPDSAMFFNDSIRVLTSIQGGVGPLTTAQSFTFPAIKRPDKFARIDSIVIRTGTLEIAQEPSKIPTPFQGADKKDITIKLTPQPVTPSTINVTLPGGATSTQTVYIYDGADLTVTGPIDTTLVKPKVTTNNTSLFDDIVVTFSSPPFANKTATYTNIPDPALYYKVFATIFYKYKAGDTMIVDDDNISTKGKKYEVVLPSDLSWSYGKAASPHNDSLPKNNKPVMYPMPESARLAMCVNNAATGSQWAIAVSKAPLNLNEPLNFVRVSQSGSYTDSSNGAPTFNRVFFTGRPVLLEWSKSGTELYYATHDNRLYRVSHITRLMDLSSASEGGKFSTDVFKYVSAINNAAPNPNTPYRTTLIGNFGNKQITSISVGNGDTLVMVTLYGTATNTNYPGSVYTTSLNARTTNSTQAWVQRDGNDAALAGKRTYCSMMEMRDNNKVFIGTDDGIVYTNNILASPPVWMNTAADAVSSPSTALPRVQVFDIEQQTLMPDAAYNSGEILVATNGRGVWSNRSNFQPWVVGIEEQEQVRGTVENNLAMFPNPTTGNVNLSFTAISGEEASMEIFDLSGRVVRSEKLGKLGSGEYMHIFETSSLNSGIYIVNVTSTSGVQRVSKLVVNR